MAEDTTEIDKAISVLTAQVVDGIKAMSTNPEVLEGLMKAAISDLVWDFYTVFPEHRDVLHNHLGSLGMAVQSAMRNPS